MVGGCIFGGGHIFKRLQYRGNFTIRVVLLFNLASFSKVIVWQLDISASSWYDSRFFEHSSYILQGDVITLSAITLSTTYWYKIIVLFTHKLSRPVTHTWQSVLASPQFFWFFIHIWESVGRTYSPVYTGKVQVDILLQEGTVLGDNGIPCNKTKEMRVLEMKSQDDSSHPNFPSKGTILRSAYSWWWLQSLLRGIYHKS